MRSALLLVLFICSLAAAQTKPMAIHVIDEDTGRGVPLVTLTTTNNITYITDSAGYVAFDEPGLLGTKVYFTIASHGYACPADGFHMRGVALDTSGGEATIKLRRLNIAQRLYRVTGQGIYAESLKLGRDAPIDNNGRVMGQDSVQTAIYHDRIYWFWGDTNRPEYPLGQFSTSGATSEMPPKIDPSSGVNLQYFTDKTGFSRPMIPLGKPGVVWIDGVVTVPDKDGRERLVCHYSRRKSLAEELEQGVAVFDDESEVFKPVVELPLDAKLHPRGHAFIVTEGDAKFIYFADPTAKVRVRATYEAMIDPAAYEAIPGGDDPMTTDAATGKPVKLHAGSICWNAYRKKWIMIANQIGGTSILGEVWYSEADAPSGPWKSAVKIVTHDQYSFYNPVQHDFFDEQDGRIIYFEGTYAATFSGNDHPTPRYDYNQMMYRLDLADERLHPATQP
ncbi:MAG: hypothetical protein GC162_13010 [Planctomycetes bacterium]|nr:hypothetical protein [Planctomycetota bacterium]